MRFIWLLSFWALSAVALDKPAAVVRMKKGTAGKPILFGLSTAQAEALYKASHRKADLRNLYIVPDRDLQAINWKDAQLDGWIDNGPVPPPGYYAASADPELATQWWREKLELDKVWAKATGKGVTIADCDSGYYTEEPDLAPNLLLNDRYDLSDREEPLKIDDGAYVSHGTSVASLLVGALDGKGTNGIAYNAKLVPLQNFNYSKEDDLLKEDATTRCILRALTIQSVKVILLENQTAQGSSETFLGTREAVRLAIASGVPVVSAAGNYALDLTIESGDDTGSILVGAVDPKGKLSGFSNFGLRLTVAGYGQDIQTLAGPNGYQATFTGTSAAAPQVAATVALMLELNPKLSPAQIRTILEKTRAITAENKDVGGLLNIVAALDEVAKTRTSSWNYNSSQQVRKTVRTILTKKP